MVNDSKRRRALIIGGSLGGLFAGNLLRRIGWSVDIFERSPHDLDSRGGGIVLQPEVVEVFRRMGVELRAVELGVVSAYCTVPSSGPTDRSGPNTSPRKPRRLGRSSIRPEGGLRRPELSPSEDPDENWSGPRLTTTPLRFASFHHHQVGRGLSPHEPLNMPSTLPRRPFGAIEKATDAAGGDHR